MAEPTLHECLGGIFAIAAVVDDFSDRLLKNPRIVEAAPELREWHTVTYQGRLPGLKWLRTLWLASVAGGPSSTPAGSYATPLRPEDPPRRVRRSRRGAAPHT